MVTCVDRPERGEQAGRPLRVSPFSATQTASMRVEDGCRPGRGARRGAIAPARRRRGRRASGSSTSSRQSAISPRRGRERALEARGEAVALAAAASAAARAWHGPASQPGCGRSCASSSAIASSSLPSANCAAARPSSTEPSVGASAMRALEQIDRRQARLQRRAGQAVGDQRRRPGASAAAFSSAATAGARSSSLR